VGLGQTLRGNIVKYGLKGSSDIVGVVGPHGKFLAIEIKTGGATHTKEQRSFETTVKLLGGYYVTLRTDQDLEKLYDILSSDTAKR
jgi:hypothetical protein